MGIQAIEELHEARRHLLAQRVLIGFVQGALDEALEGQALKGRSLERHALAYPLARHRGALKSSLLQGFSSLLQGFARQHAARYPRAPLGFDPSDDLPPRGSLPL